MFDIIQKTLSTNGISGCGFSVKPAEGTKISVILSFSLSSIGDAEHKLFERDNGGAELIALRSALSVPIVVTCEPNEVDGAISKLLNDIHTGFVEAATVYSTTDINALLNAASGAVKAKAGAAKKQSSTAKASETSVQDDDLDVDDENSESSGSVEQAASPSNEVNNSSFDDFDSL